MQKEENINSILVISISCSCSSPTFLTVHKDIAMTSSSSDHVEKEEETELVTVVGNSTVGSQVDLATLRELYLPQTPSDREVNHEDGTVVFKTTHSYPPVRRLRPSERKRILVTGGAGFVGSHLVDRLMLMGHEVIVLDNFFTGTKRNVQHWIGHPHFELVRHDVVDPFMIEVSQIYHLACPASPPHYQYNPTKTVKTSVMGTINMLGLAKRTKARFLLTSTSGIRYITLFMQKKNLNFCIIRNLR